MDKITRRRLMLSGATLAGGALFETGTRGSSSPPIHLEAKWMERTMDGIRMKLRTYNGQVPGPLIKTRPGDTLRIRMKNSLPPVSMKGWDHNHNVPHLFNTTNLHLHGLDIAPHLFTPLGTSDPTARMIAIEPGEQLDYAFEIPEDHPPGLYWYHPHHHGSTAVQAVSGMAGAVIVYGDIDEVPEIKAARDIPLVIQDIGLFPGEKEPNLWTYEPVQNAMWDTLTGTVWIYDPKTQKPVTQPNLKGGFTAGDYRLRYFLMNGQPFFKEAHNFAPGKGTIPVAAQLPVARIILAPGEVVRFRMLNGCSDNYMPIVVEGHDMHLIALDGVNFETLRTIPSQPVSAGTWEDGQIALSPANRAEFLIKANSKPGIYRIVQLAQDKQFLMSEQKTIAEIVVQGAPKNMQLPKKLPVQRRYYPTLQPQEVKLVRNIVFAGTFPAVVNPYVGIDFTVNNNSYDELAVPIVSELNSVEEWHLQVLGAHHGGTEGHPFHIHVNHFEVVSIGGTAVTAPLIMDTIWVPMHSTVVIRMKFNQWKGKSVFHCHILPHEDTGMMQNFLIAGPTGGGRHF